MKKKINYIILILYLILLFLFVEIKIYHYDLWQDTIKTVRWNRTQGFWNYNLIPLRTIKSYLLECVSIEVTLCNLLGNIIPFIPLGFCLAPLIDKKYRILCVWIVSLLCILGFEIIQFYSCLGYFDVDDLILNVSSSMIGYSIYCIIEHNIKILSKKVVSETGGRS